jgi:putative SOS response-associated peptidase YedK
VCGRTTLVNVSKEDLRAVFDLVGEIPDLKPRYNLAPSQELAVIRTPGLLEVMTWGPKFINAKIETATSKAQNRCLVVVDGFFEWRRKDGQPFHFHRPDRKPFALGGVTRTSVNACAIVTCPAGEGMIGIHHRMPLVLTRDGWQAWLAGEKPSGTLAEIERTPVSKHVNNYRNDDPECIVPVTTTGPSPAAPRSSSS